MSYLRQSGILFRLWMPPQHFAPGTPPDVDHPDWGLVPKAPDGITGWYGLNFCAAAQGAHDYMRRFMLDREKRYGTFYYRLDGWIQAPCWATNHDHPPGQPHVQQYRHYLRMLREVKDADPAIGIQGCNSGGEWSNWDKIELLENQQASDGGGSDDLYYLSYFWPIAKLTAWGVASTSLGDTSWERVAQDVLLRRFLRQQGVYDRYMRVYHPKADGAPTPHTYLELTDGSRTRAAIFQDALPAGEVVVYPKALVPDARYTVAFRSNAETRTAGGAELMKQGIRFRTALRQEIVLLNLESAPGRGTDHTPPTAPANLSKRVETWNGRQGVALRWSPSRDNVLVAGYEILRDGKTLDRAGAGTFYFDTGAEAGLSHRYEVLAIDGDGNRSGSVAAGQE